MVLAFNQRISSNQKNIIINQKTTTHNQNPNLFNSNLNHAILFILKDTVSLFDLVKRETMGDKWGSVYLTLLDEAEHFLTVAAIHATSLECKVLAVHIWQWKHLRFVVESHDGDNGIRTCALPSQLERAIASCHFQHSISATIVAVGFDKVETSLRGSKQNVRIMLTYKGAALIRFLTYYDAFGLL